MILVVDNNKILTKIVKSILEQNRLNCIRRHSANDAVDWLQDNPCDLVISGLHLSDSNETELYQWVRNNRAQTKIILITSLDCGEIFELNTYWEITEQRLLKKPFTPEELIKCVFNELAAEYHNAS